MTNAPVWKKVLAFIIDLVGSFVILGFVIAVATGNTTDNGFSLNGGPALLLFALVIAYFVVMNKKFGGTLGKRLFGIAAASNLQNQNPLQSQSTMQTAEAPHNSLASAPSQSQPVQNQEVSSSTLNPQAASTWQSSTTQSPSASNKKLIGTGIAVTVAILLILLYVFVLAPSIQARAAATEYMTAATNGNIEKLVALSGEDTPASKAFARDVADSMKGDFKGTESAKENGKWHYLYTLDGSGKKYARLIVEKQDGKWQVSSVVYSNERLLLVPKESTSSSSSKPTTDTQAPSALTPQATTSLACLTQDDYKYFNYDKQPSTVTYDNTYNPAKPTFNKTGNMFFKPDSTQEDSFSSVYDDWADFANNNSGKQWKFRLEGSVFGNDSATQSSKQLAVDRSNEVKNELEKRGVPAERIIIDSPHDYSKEVQNASDKIYRRVQVLIDPTCTSSAR